MKLQVLDTERMSSSLRAKSVDPSGRRLLVTDLRGTTQEKDLSEPPNCGGLGRIRHFRRGTTPGWPPNPLPVDPACKALGLGRADLLRTQVFQYAACNWRCWYCFVDFSSLLARQSGSTWATADELIDLYLRQDEPPSVIDLSGGQPDLAPEWVPWMMDALTRRGLAEHVYLWSDDNLSNDYFWKHLNAGTRGRIADYATYGRVGCFKGFDPQSFSFNTNADPALFEQQFDLASRFIDAGIDLYGYVTLTTADTTGLARRVRSFVDRLQHVDELFPLRVVPLRIEPFGPVESRLDPIRRASLGHQDAAVECWLEEMTRRFGIEHAADITAVRLR